MKMITCIKGLMALNGVTQSFMADLLGLASFRGVQMRLSGNDMRVKSAVEMLSRMGYELVVQEKRKGNRRDDQIIITEKDSESEMEFYKRMKDIRIFNLTQGGYEKK